MEDAGDYECVAENSLGRATGTINLRVFAEPIIELMPSETRYRLTEGDELHITCMASGVPNPTVYWNSTGHSPVYAMIGPTYGHNSADLSFYSVSQSDAGVYACEANNEVGDDVKYISIDVQPKRGDIGERK